jgi:hypothetical protein
MIKKIMLYVVSGLLVVSVAGNIYQYVKKQTIIQNITNAYGGNASSTSIAETFINGVYTESGKITWKHYDVEIKDYNKWLNAQPYIFAKDVQRISKIRNKKFLKKEEYYSVEIPEVEIKK